MVDAPRDTSAFPILTVGLLVVVGGMATATSFERQRTDLAVHDISFVGGDIKVTFATAQSRILKRPVSRLILIEGKRPKKFSRYEWRRYPAEWYREENVLVSDGEGIRYVASSAFRLLWKDDPQAMGIGLLRQVAHECRDEELLGFLARNAP